MYKGYGETLNYESEIEIHPSYLASIVNASLCLVQFYLKCPKPENEYKTTDSKN